MPAIFEHCNYCQKRTETLEISGGDCKVCGCSKVTPLQFKVGLGIRASWKGDVYRVEGIIEKIIKPHETLTESEMKKYAGIEPGHKAYKSVQGASCKVTRLILKKSLDEHYTIVPVNLNSWKIIIKKLLCSFCGKEQTEVKNLIAGGPNYSEQRDDDGKPIYICDECIEMCNDLIKERKIK